MDIAGVAMGGRCGGCVVLMTSLHLPVLSTVQIVRVPHSRAATVMLKTIAHEALAVHLATSITEKKYFAEERLYLKQ